MRLPHVTSVATAALRSIKRKNKHMKHDLTHIETRISHQGKTREIKTTRSNGVTAQDDIHVAQEDIHVAQEDIVDARQTIVAAQEELKGAQEDIVAAQEDIVAVQEELL